jgi:hypothetical protein
LTLFPFLFFGWEIMMVVVTGYIGKMGLERVKEVAETLSSLHHLLWEENDHNQP